MIKEVKYCSVCHWATDEPQQFPPKWRCLLLDNLIENDIDAEQCKHWVRLSVVNE